VGINRSGDDWGLKLILNQIALLSNLFIKIKRRHVCYGVVIEYAVDFLCCMGHKKFSSMSKKAKHFWLVMWYAFREEYMPWNVILSGWVTEWASEWVKWAGRMSERIERADGVNEQSVLAYTVEITQIYSIVYIEVLQTRLMDGESDRKDPRTRVKCS